MKQWISWRKLIVFVGMDTYWEKLRTFLRRALDLKVKETMKRCSPKKTWLKAVVEESR